MKKLLIFMLVLGMASLANAGLIDLVIDSYGAAGPAGWLPGEPIPVTDPITGTKTIELLPSDWIDLTLYYTGDVGRMLPGFGITISVGGTGAATVYANSEFLSYPYYMGMELPGFEIWDPLLELITSNPDGGVSIIEGPGPFQLNGTGNPEMMLDHILLHCDGPGDVVLSLSITSPGDNGEVDVGTWANMTIPDLGTDVYITQVPEPMTVLLLGLGGLFLRRRK